MAKRVRQLSQEKRTSILEGAMHAFTEYGFEGTSMDKIATLANVSKITIYKHFQNKETLFLEMVTQYLEENKTYKQLDYSQDTTIEEQLKTFIKAEVFRVTDPKQRGLSRLLTSVYLYRADLVKETMQQNPFYVDFMSWLTKAKEAGKIRCSSERRAARMFYGLIHGCITWDALLTDGESLVDTDELIDEIIAMFMKCYGA